MPTTITLAGSPEELACYGCSREELGQSVDAAFSVKFPEMGGYAMVVASMLSDAQEEIERGLDDQARKTLNRAKWVLANRIMNKPFLTAR